METFYVSPQDDIYGGGDVMGKDQVLKQDPSFFDKDRNTVNQYGYAYKPGAPPPDESGESENFGGAYDTRLVADAKRDFEEADPELVRKLGVLMGDPSTLNKLTFSEEDVIVMPDITGQNKEDLTQALELLYVLGDDLYDYMEHIYKLKGTPFADFLRRQPEDNLTQRGVGQKTVISGTHPLELLLAPVEEGQVGMGRSLIFGRVDRIITGALANLNNMTPIEFRDAVYPAVESVVRKAYARMPHIQANKHIEELDNALEAYLEAIHYVLAEVIGEINFEYTYDAAGNEQMIFIPSDPEVRKKLDEYSRLMHGGYYTKEAIKSKIASDFRESMTYGASPEEQLILRDIPHYYNIKFSVNPKEAGALKEQSSITHDWRLKVNLGFGYGLPEFEIDQSLGYDAMEVYDDG